MFALLSNDDDCSLNKYLIFSLEHFHDDDNTAISYITANESSNPNNIRKVYFHTVIMLYNIFNNI